MLCGLPHPSWRFRDQASLIDPFPLPHPHYGHIRTPQPPSACPPRLRDLLPLCSHQWPLRYSLQTALQPHVFPVPSNGCSVPPAFFYPFQAHHAYNPPHLQRSPMSAVTIPSPQRRLPGPSRERWLRQGRPCRCWGTGFATPNGLSSKYYFKLAIFWQTAERGKTLKTK